MTDGHPPAAPTPERENGRSDASERLHQLERDNEELRSAHQNLRAASAMLAGELARSV